MEIYQNLANPSTSCFVNFLKTIFQISFLSYFFFAFDIYTDVEVIKAFKGEYQHANVSDEEMNVLVLGSKKWAKFPQNGQIERNHSVRPPSQRFGEDAPA